MHGATWQITPKKTERAVSTSSILDHRCILSISLLCSALVFFLAANAIATIGIEEIVSSSWRPQTRDVICFCCPLGLRVCSRGQCAKLSTSTSESGRVLPHCVHQACSLRQCCTTVQHGAAVLQWHNGGMHSAPMVSVRFCLAHLEKSTSGRQQQ